MDVPYPMTSIELNNTPEIELNNIHEDNYNQQV